MVSRARVAFIKELSSNTREYILELELNFHHEPGQFLQLTLENVDSSMIWPDSRSFSIASYKMPNKQLRLIIKKEGKFTTKLFSDVRVNDVLTVKLPYGSFFPPIDLSPTLCLAGGTGIAPFLSFFDYFKINNNLKKFFLFHSTKFIVDAVDYHYLLKELNGNYKLFLTVDKFDEAKLLNFFSAAGINFQNIASNDAMIAARIMELESEGYSLVHVTSAVESFSGNDDGSGIFISRMYFRKSVSLK
jgi:NAD(P)H-flavin reductase